MPECEVAATATIRMNTNSSVSAIPIQPSTSPATAMPSPDSPFCLIWRRAAWPMITAAMLAGVHTKIWPIPQISEPTASEFVRCG